MELIGVLAAAVAAFAYGAVHYSVLSKQWVAVSGVKMDENGKPIGPQPAYLPFIFGFVAMILVAGMMRHILSMSGITTVGGSLVAGLGIGAFFITPWTMMNNAYPGRPFLLTVIDGAYATIGCGIIGGVLALL